jgi:hypothetical protein
MTDEEIQTRLAALGKLDFRGAETLGTELLVEGREPLRALQRLMILPDKSGAAKAEAVLNLQYELAIIPWLVVARGLDGPLQIPAISAAWRSFEILDKQITTILRAMLERRTALRPPDLGAIEVPPPITRECDHAFLMLRRLSRPDEPEDESHRYGTAFSRLSAKRRERLILDYLKTTRFGDPVEEGPA